VPRKYTHYEVRFTRTVNEEQFVGVAVDAKLSPEVANEVARELAEGRLREGSWKLEHASNPKLENVSSDPGEA